MVVWLLEDRLCGGRGRCFGASEYHREEPPASADVDFSTNRLQEEGIKISAIDSHEW